VVFGIGGSELLLIAFVALMIFGPQRIPELARTAARGYKELVRLRRQVDHTIEEVKRDLDLEQELKQLDPPLLREPDGERVSSELIPSKASHSPATASRTANPPLVVPVEDDYLSGDSS
jgi:TatA/E family protein of Tat protein translocase